MFVVKKSEQNPIVTPQASESWQSLATFNPSVVRSSKAKEKNLHMVFRAMGNSEYLNNEGPREMSVIGYAKSVDNKTFKDKRKLIYPEYIWEKFGCEDPRVTYFEGSYYIFYTAISSYPFGPEGIKIAVAKTNDFEKIDEKHLVTPFNSKAMALFPERINGRIAAILSAHTDRPPALFTIAYFDREEEIWDQNFWHKWEEDAEYHAFDLRRSPHDQIEAGSQPIKTPYGWLLIYSHIQNYFGGGDKIFGIEAILLDLHDPHKMIGRTKGPIIAPEENYEKRGIVENITFPSGGELVVDTLHIYYGGADTVCCKATVDLHDLIEAMIPKRRDEFIVRYSGNPVLSPNTKNEFESKAVFNPAAIDLNGSIHIVYRSMSSDNTSYMGYARTEDGLSIVEKLDVPIYGPRADFEGKGVPGGNSGCEDPRVMEIGNRIYMTYTAYNGLSVPRVAMTSILTSDFLKHNWNWTPPELVTIDGIDDKDAALVPEKLSEGFLFIHRIRGVICGAYLKSLDVGEAKVKTCIEIMRPRKGLWDSKRIGIAGPPIKVRRGGKSFWLQFYHGISEEGIYRFGAALLDYKDPTQVISRTTDYIMGPETEYEKYGQVNQVVFPCGHVVRKNTVYIYYGGADSVVGIATLSLSKLLSILK